MEIEEMFTAGIEFRDRGEFDNAIEIFHSIIDAFPLHPKMAVVYAVIAGIYRKKDDHQNAKIYFGHVLGLNPKSEVASVGLYVSLVELGEDEKAILELKRYLEENPANLYKITLQELLDGLKEGYMTKHEQLITSLAKRHNL